MIDDDAAAKAAQYQGLFATPLIMADLQDAGSLVAELKTVIAERRASHPGTSRSNMGGWQSDTAMLQWGGSSAYKLAALVLHMCNRFTRDVGQTDPSQPRFEWSGQMWANICPPTVGHESHTHPGSLWSSVFYVDDGLAEGDEAEAAGVFVLQDPRNPTPVMYQPDLRIMDPDGSTYRSDHRVAPKVGRVMAFPSWVAHWVTPHQGARDRVSISMNMLALPARTEHHREAGV
jgi:uncharacterized protein (TIGR02466 family)